VAEKIRGIKELYVQPDEYKFHVNVKEYELNISVVHLTNVLLIGAIEI